MSQRCYQNFESILLDQVIPEVSDMIPEFEDSLLNQPQLPLPAAFATYYQKLLLVDIKPV
jgi:hypothetical protein